PQWLHHSIPINQTTHGSTVAARQNQGIQLIEVFRPFYQNALRSACLKRLKMLANSALQSKNSYSFHLYQPRSCMRSPAAMVEISIPFIAMPKSFESSAINL